MYEQIFKVALVFAALRSPSSCLGQNNTSVYGTAKIGQRCERDRNCIRYAYCRTQMTCFCDPYYSPTLDNSICIASAGLGCLSDATCSLMTNAICRQGVCACKDSYILDIRNSSNCISRPSVVQDRCQRNDECQDALDRAMCINGRCQCISSHHFVNETGKCVPSRVLFNACEKDYECVSTDDGNALECRQGECVCKKGEAACNKGSTLTAVGIFLILLHFIPS